MSDPYNEKLAELVRRIYRRTVTGAIKWSDAQGREGVYEADISGRPVTIGLVEYEVDGMPSQDVEISIYDNQGAKIESIRDSGLGNVVTKVEGFSGWYSLMYYTYETARRQVSGSEGAINDLLTALDDIPF